MPARIMTLRPQHAMAIALIVSVAPAAAAQPRKQPPASAAAPAAPGVKPLSQTLTGEAKSAYDAAKLLLGDGDFAGAAIKFQAAYDQSSDARLLWNIAACEKSQRHYARTMALVRQYLDTGKDLLTDADRREGRALLDTIESFTVRLTIVVKEPGADVYVDDERVGTSPPGSRLFGRGPILFCQMISPVTALIACTVLPEDKRKMTPL